MQLAYLHWLVARSPAHTFDVLGEATFGNGSKCGETNGEYAWTSERNGRDAQDRKKGT